MHMRLCQCACGPTAQLDHHPPPGQAADPTKAVRYPFHHAEEVGRALSDPARDYVEKASMPPQCPLDAADADIGQTNTSMEPGDACGGRPEDAHVCPDCGRPFASPPEVLDAVDTADRAHRRAAPVARDHERAGLPARAVRRHRAAPSGAPQAAPAPAMQSSEAMAEEHHASPCEVVYVCAADLCAPVVDGEREEVQLQPVRVLSGASLASTYHESYGYRWHARRAPLLPRRRAGDLLLPHAGGRPSLSASAQQHLAERTLADSGYVLFSML